MMFSELFELIKDEPFVIFQKVVDNQTEIIVSAWVQTRNCLNNNSNLERQMNEKVLKIKTDAMNGRGIMKIYLTNSNN